jgi:hypothetical protein
MDALFFVHVRAQPLVSPGRNISWIDHAVADVSVPLEWLPWFFCSQLVGKFDLASRVSFAEVDLEDKDQLLGDVSPQT